jgi:hypothetical protein
MSILPFLGCDFLIEAIQVLQLRYVASHSYDIFADFLRGFIQLRLSPSRDENERPFRDEALSGGEPDSAAASGDHSHLAL